MYILKGLAIALYVPRALCQSSPVPPPAEPTSVLPTSENVVITEPSTSTEPVISTEPGSDPDISTSAVIATDDTTSPTDVPDGQTSVSVTEGGSSSDGDLTVPTTTAASTTAAEATLTESATTSPSSTQTSESVPIDLSNTTLGENAVFGEVNGETAIVLSPPAWGQASLSISATAPQDLASGDKIRVQASLFVADTSARNRRSISVRQAGGPTYNLEVSVNGASAYNDTLTASAGKTLDINSGPVPVTEKPTVDVVLRAGAKPVGVSIYNVKLLADRNLSGSSDKTTTKSTGNGAETTSKGGGGNDKGSSGGSPSSTASASGKGSQGNDDDSKAGSIYSRSYTSDSVVWLAFGLFVLVV